MRLHIEYLDQNESFAAQLPRDGVVVAQPRSIDSQLLWYLVQLDASVIYENVKHTQLLIASRWQDGSIDGVEPTSVFILLVPPNASVPEGFSYKHYSHVAWGMSHVVDA